MRGYPDPFRRHLHLLGCSSPRVRQQAQSQHSGQLCPTYLGQRPHGNEALRLQRPEDTETGSELELLRGKKDTSPHVGVRLDILRWTRDFGATLNERAAKRARARGSEVHSRLTGRVSEAACRGRGDPGRHFVPCMCTSEQRSGQARGCLTGMVKP